MFKAIEIDGMYLEFASRDLQNDRQRTLVAFHNNVLATQLASQRC